MISHKKFETNSNFIKNDPTRNLFKKASLKKTNHKTIENLQNYKAFPKQDEYVKLSLDEI